MHARTHGDQKRASQDDNDDDDSNASLPGIVKPESRVVFCVVFQLGERERESVLV